MSKKLTPIQKAVSNDLVNIYNLLRIKKQWCKRALCRDAEGEMLYDPQDERACQWCVLGAYYKLECCPDTLQFLERQARFNKFSGIHNMNDYSTYRYIIDFLLASLRSFGYKIEIVEKS